MTRAVVGETCLFVPRFPFPRCSFFPWTIVRVSTLRPLSPWLGKYSYLVKVLFSICFSIMHARTPRQDGQLTIPPDCPISELQLLGIAIISFERVTERRESGRRLYGLYALRICIRVAFATLRGFESRNLRSLTSIDVRIYIYCSVTAIYIYVYMYTRETARRIRIFTSSARLRLKIESTRVYDFSRALSAVDVAGQKRASRLRAWSDAREPRCRATSKSVDLL